MYGVECMQYAYRMYSSLWLNYLFVSNVSCECECELTEQCFCDMVDMIEG